jgi:hypothetical protein
MLNEIFDANLAKISEKISNFFRLSAQKESETDPVSLLFASKRYYLCETCSP